MLIVQLAVLLSVMFAGLVVMLRWLMARYATTTITHLQTLSQDYVKKQEELKTRLEESERHYQEQLVKAQEEVRQLKMQGAKEAEAARQQVVDQARREAERIVQQAVQARDAMQQDLAQTVEARAVERACELLQQALPEGLRQAAHAQWMAQLMANGLVPTDRLQLSEDVRQARVVSAFPLTAEQREHLLERLQVAVGTSVTCEETVDPHLVAGLIVTIGHTVLDGSLASKLQQAARHA